MYEEQVSLNIELFILDFLVEISFASAGVMPHRPTSNPIGLLLQKIPICQSTSLTRVYGSAPALKYLQNEGFWKGAFDRFSQRRVGERGGPFCWSRSIISVKSGPLLPSLCKRLKRDPVSLVAASGKRERRRGQKKVRLTFSFSGICRL